MDFLTRAAAIACIAMAAGPLGCSGPSITLDEGRFKAPGAGVLQVYVSGSADPLFGERTFVDGASIFEPRFPLRPGLTYRAVFERSHRETVERTFAIPAPPPSPATVVRAVFPSADALPENLLKFYLHFSAPMAKGEVYGRVHLLDSAGKPVELPFLELGEELWDRSGTRVTLLFDPGRIKRGLKPREDSGPALEEGKSYTLIVDKAWRDADGRPLDCGFSKPFKVVAPDEKQPDPKAWTIHPARAGSVEALEIRFDEPLDEALASRVISVVDREGRPLAGRIEIDRGETRGRFHPEGAWKAGPHAVRIDVILEDRAGNSVERPFEVDIVRPVERSIRSRVMDLPFEVVPR